MKGALYVLWNKAIGMLTNHAMHFVWLTCSSASYALGGRYLFISLSWLWRIHLRPIGTQAVSLVSSRMSARGKGQDISLRSGLALNRRTAIYTKTCCQYRSRLPLQSKRRSHPDRGVQAPYSSFRWRSRRPRERDIPGCQSTSVGRMHSQSSYSCSETRSNLSWHSEPLWC